jgi:hypothetical protein
MTISLGSSLLPNLDGSFAPLSPEALDASLGPLFNRVCELVHNLAENIDARAA